VEELPQQEEWLNAKQVAKIFGISTARVYYAHNVGRKNKTGCVVKLQMFKTFSGLATTRKMVNEFLGKLNG
jgi:transposase